VGESRPTVRRPEGPEGECPGRERKCSKFSVIKRQLHKHLRGKGGRGEQGVEIALNQGD